MQVGQVSQFSRYRVTQLVDTEVQNCQVRQAAQFRGYRPAQLVAYKVQLFQLGQVAQLGGYRAAQLIVVEIQLDDTALVVRLYAVPSAKRQAGQPVAAMRPVLPVRAVVERDQHGPVSGRGFLRAVLQTKFVQVACSDMAQHIRDAAGQLVPPEMQPLQMGEVAQRSGYRAAQLVVTEVQFLQVGQAAQFRGYRAAQPVAIEVQSSDAALFVRLHTVPIANRLFAQPVLAMRPVRAVRTGVERDQSRPVIRRRWFGRWFRRGRRFGSGFRLRQAETCHRQRELARRPGLVGGCLYDVVPSFQRHLYPRVVVPVVFIYVVILRYLFAIPVQQEEVRVSLRLQCYSYIRLSGERERVEARVAALPAARIALPRPPSFRLLSSKRELAVRLDRLRFRRGFRIRRRIGRGRTADHDRQRELARHPGGEGRRLYDVVPSFQRLPYP